MSKRFYLVGITRPTGGTGLTYDFDQELKTGQLVEVAVRGRAGAGIILAESNQPAFKTQPIKRTLELPPLPNPLLELGRWLADYYAAEPASAWQTILPAGLLKQRRVRPPSKQSPATEPPATLTGEQAEAIKAIEASQQTTSLLLGVTGSGKTEVYQELVERQLASGRSAIILVPEIALTPQTEERFRNRFGDRILISHSNLTEAERYAVWSKALNASKPMVAIGPRSALFLPLAKLGLIVIDECHETSYKQEQSPRFETAAAAATLAKAHGAKLVLGSATPSLKEAFLAKQGRIQLAELSRRYNAIEPAPPLIVDLKDPLEFRSNPIFSKTLLSHLEESYRHHRQSLLFLNRRGSASSQLCTNCGYVSVCPNCRLPLTFHADSARLICHICNYRATPPAVCPQCGQAAMKFIGFGTKRVGDELAKLFPKSRIARLDKDSLDKGIDQLYQDLANHQIDFLIGTQMVAKGLDLPAMETVGVVLADTSLYLPDYTATERTYSLLTQVSGRAGRGDHPGRTIIQTYSPKHPVIASLSKSYWEFADAELADRRLLGYPPYRYLLKLTYSHKDDQTVQAAAQKLADQLCRQDNIQVIGPAPAFRRYATGLSHWHVVVKAARRHDLVEVARQVPGNWTIDLDPVNLL